MSHSLELVISKAVQFTAWVSLALVFQQFQTARSQVKLLMLSSIDWPEYAWIQNKESLGTHAVCVISIIFGKWMCWDCLICFWEHVCTKTVARYQTSVSAWISTFLVPPHGILWHPMVSQLITWRMVRGSSSGLGKDPFTLFTAILLVSTRGPISHANTHMHVDLAWVTATHGTIWWC